MIKRAKRIAELRIISQLAALVILAMPYLNLKTIPGLALHCHGCPWSAFACPLGVLSNFCQLKLIPYVAIGILGLIGVIGGRIVCGWICPFGLLQDLMDKVRKTKIHIPYVLTYTKYLVLIGLVLAVPYFFPTSPYRFCKLCPVATLETSIPALFTGDLAPAKLLQMSYYLKFGILAAVLTMIIFSSRAFCRTLCPLGAIFSLFNKISLFRLRLTKHDCNYCRMCAKICSVEIHPVKQMNDTECTRCLDCTATDHIKLGTG
jgi:polyferredoxin